MGELVQVLNRFILFEVGLLLLLPAQYAANAQGAQSTPAKIKLEDTKVFFSDFLSKSKLPERGEFETKEDYQKRLPTPWDSSKLVYFPVKMSSAMDWKFKDFCEHSYDIDKQILTMEAGDDVGYIDDDSFKPAGIPPIALLVEDKDSPDVEMENEEGASVTVQRSTFTNYAIYITNASSIELSHFDQEHKRFIMSLSGDPKVAEKLSKACEMVVGVYPLSYQDTLTGFSQHVKPTFDNPMELWDYMNGIKVRVHNLLLIDTSNNNAIVAHYDVPDEKTVP